MVQGLSSLKRKLTVTIPERVQKRTQEAMEKGATELVAMMKALAPKDSGALASSIGWTWGDAPAGSFTLGTVGSRDYATMRITIYAGNAETMVTNSRGVEFQNAILQEFGTQDMPPSPYFYVSWRFLRRRIKSRITREMKKAIKEGAK